MKRTLIILITILVILFTGITLLKNHSSQINRKSTVRTKTSEEKDKISQFWHLYRQATQYRLEGEIENAVLSYREALKLNEKHEDALYYLGNVFLEMGKFENAEKAWQRLIKINPNSARAHFQLGDLYLNFTDEKFFNIDAAEAEYLRVHEINKEETGPTLRLGYVDLIRNNLSESKGFFDAVLGSNNQSVPALFLNGYIAWKSGDRPLALTLIEKARKYSHPEIPIEGVLGEGDTKEGLAFSLSESSRHQSLFVAFIRELSKMNKIIISQEMDNRYEALDAFLKEIREKI